MMRGAVIAAMVIAAVSAGCPMRPSTEDSSTQRIPGDDGYRILISGTNDKYLPNSVYTISLRGSRSHERLQQFTKFTLSVDSQYLANDTQNQVGYFQLFPDSLTTFNEDCVNTVSEANDLSKSEIQVMWRSPPAGSGCVIFTAMVLVDQAQWYAEDGSLSRTFCEMTTVEVDQFEGARCCACDEAKYSLVMEGLWTSATHPKDFPTSLWLTHFSDLIGASHESNFTFWGKGHISTDGFRQLAEWGSATGVEAELRANSRFLRTLIKAAGLWYPNVNSNTSANFRVDRKHPSLSVASMLGPSPDWVIGVSNLNLCNNDCTWKSGLNVDLYPWDAGTDNGISYLSPNSETKPRERMKPITTSYPEDPRSPFYNPSGRPMLPLARLYINREKVIPRGCDEEALQAQLVEFEVAENTEDTSRPECMTTPYSPWSPCSVTCGKGLRMRTREYKIPEKAAMMSCNRQLVSKEMCVAAAAECPGNEGEEEELPIAGTDTLCETTEWGEWSECSATCGIGTKQRTRKFKNRMGRKKCPHVNLSEKLKCMEPECPPGAADDVPIECRLTYWSDWSPCSTSCGDGVKTRTRLLIDEDKRDYCSTRVVTQEHRSCNERDCTLDMATAKAICMEETEVGSCRGSFVRWSFVAQKLMCVPFQYTGCKGNRNNFASFVECDETCSIVRAVATGAFTPSGNVTADAERVDSARINEINEEPVDCVVSEWSPWSPCSVTCGSGRFTSFRTVQRQARNGGLPCPKKLQRRARCQLAPCN